jgi:hypothetical protein
MTGRGGYVLALLLAGCGVGESTDAAAPNAPAEAAQAMPPPPIDLRFEGGFVRKAALRGGGGFLVLIEPPLRLTTEIGQPRRELRWVGRDGTVERRLASSPGRHLLDVAVHPSGETTVLLAGHAGYTLARFDPVGSERGETLMMDPAIATDPPALAPGAPAGPIGAFTLDTGRVAPVAEEVVVATRTSRNSVVVHRFAFSGGGFLVCYRTLAVPPLVIAPIGLTGGSYDTFALVEAQYAVHLAAAADGLAYVGVRYPELAAARLPRLFRDVFGERLSGDPDGTDSYVVRIAPDGRRLGTSVVGGPRPDEIHGLRAVRGAAYALGRNEEWNAQGTGFDALLARIDAVTGAVELRELHVDRGDIAFDVAPTDDGGLILVGARGYSQNPHGASVSEESHAFARWLAGDGRIVDAAVPDGPRHNEARFITRLDASRFLIGGMLDGPGTHSADADPSQLRAAGFLTEISTSPRGNR